MKKLVNLIALVMLVSTNVFTPFSYAQDVLPEVIPENEMENVVEDGEIPEISEETPDLDPEEKGEIEQEKQEDETAEKVLSDVQDDIETPATDETEEEDIENNEVIQSVGETLENEIQDEDLQGDEVGDDFLLQKEDETIVIQVQSGTTATLLPGQQFNQTIKRLAGNSSATYSTSNTTINQIIQWTGDTIPLGVTTTGISTSDSEKEVIAWYDSGIIYYSSEAGTIYMNSDSSYMFYYMQGLTGLDLSNIYTDNVINMSNMFYECSSLVELDLSDWDTNNVTDMWLMFYKCTNLETIYAGAGFKVSNVNGVDNVFISPKLIGGNGTKNRLVSRASSIIYAKIDEPGQLGYFTNKNAITVKFMVGMDEYETQVVHLGDVALKPADPKREGANFLKWIDKDGNEYDFTKKVEKYIELYAKFDTGGSAILLPGMEFNETVKKMSNSNTVGYDSSNSTIKQIVRSQSIPEGVVTTGVSVPYSDKEIVAWYDNGIIYYTSEAEIIYLNLDSSYMFYYLKGLTGLDMSGWDTSNVKNMRQMFYNCSNLTWIDLHNWNTSNVNDMSFMFEYCSKLENIDISEWDTSNVETMNSMFEECYSITELDLSKWDISSVTDLGYMFFRSRGLVKLNVAGWDTSNVTEMHDFVYDIPGLTGLDLSGRDFTKWKSNDFVYGFQLGTLRNLENLNLTNTKFSGSMDFTFVGMNSIKEINFEGSDVSKVTSMRGVFDYCSSLVELDLSSWDTKNVMNMEYMFFGMQNLKTIYASDKFVATGATGDGSMFTNDISLIGGNGTKFDMNYMDKTYAKIDKVGQTGYFTDKNAITVKFINTLDGTETLATFARGQKLTPPYVDKYHVVGGYLDEAMTQKIDLNKGVDSYTVIYVKYDHNGSSGGGGGGGSSKDTDKDTHGSAEDSQQNNTQDDKNTENVIQSETKGSEESSNTPIDSSDKSSEGQEILSPSDSSFTKEQKDAYTFAKENGITTKDTIQSAQMNGKLTRIAMAKMLSQYAINVLGKEPDVSKGVIKFNDVTSKKDAEYDNGVTLAYQLGIMGQNMPGNKFRPNDEVTRAEFATALSRMSYGTSDGEYEATSKYYIHHMEKLVKEGIITKDDPNMKELRGYVMIMLMRSAEG